MTQASVGPLFEQAVMHESVQPYFHIGAQPRRLPVTVHNTTDLGLGPFSLFGRPVVIREGSAEVRVGATDDQNILMVDALELGDDRAHLRFRHVVEGVVVEADYSRRDGDGWTLTRLEAYEE
ncbi:hypothetical protein [Roseospira goensis]|uniref:Uncharacterized protein n=1 Tax=Roseospira goensis TaxID=391922 RepID=A0A7W6RWK1_9PROT|nr:hypothetical protein [Roseospira goensis]MBB4284568.1 hypothetical protein [Roseospira goensis]